MTGILRYQRIGAAVSLALALTAMPAAHAQVAAAVGGLTTSATISQIFSGLDQLISSAQDAGDYLTMRAAIEAKGVIETWKEANKELLDKAFSELSETQRQTFNNARQLTERANQDVANRLETTQLLVNQANQLVESRRAKRMCHHGTLDISGLSANPVALLLSFVSEVKVPFLTQCR